MRCDLRFYSRRNRGRLRTAARTKRARQFLRRDRRKLLFPELTIVINRAQHYGSYIEVAADQREEFLVRQLGLLQQASMFGSFMNQAILGALQDGVVAAKNFDLPLS